MRELNDDWTKPAIQQQAVYHIKKKNKRKEYF